MAESVYRVTEVIGVEQRILGSCRAQRRGDRGADRCATLRVAEVIRQDLTVEDGGVASYRVRLGISFKYDSGD